MRATLRRALRVLFLAALTALFVTVLASAEGELAVGAGCTTGSSLRLRAEPNTSADIVTMLDKGLAVAVLDTSDPAWYKINYNGSVGYVSADYMILDRDNLFTTFGRVVGDSVNVRTEATIKSDSKALLDRNAIVTVNGITDGWYSVTCRYGTTGYIRSDFLVLTNSDEPVPTASATGTGSDIVAYAKQFLGTRYSSSGFDCSGFTMYVFSQFGVTLPHTASGQWQNAAGTKVYTIAELQPGDLVLFNDPSRNAGKCCSHAGIYIGDYQHIHASSAKSGVVISDLSSGYYNRYFVGGIHFA